MKKMLVFDMDGTIADLYNTPNWLECLRNFDSTPYKVAEPIYNIDVLNAILEVLKVKGYKIAVTTWLSKETTPEYTKQVRKAKKEWLEKHNFPYDEFHAVAYGTTKANSTRKVGGYQILIDDNEKVRKGWNLGSTIDATQNILIELVKLLEE